jgi:outer membrane protein insertion porin family
MGFPTSEYGSVGLRYTISDAKISPYAGAPTVIQEAAGSEVTSAFGYSYTYNTIDDPIKPRHGYSMEVSQDFAGFGGNTKYFRTLLAGGWYHPVFWDEMVSSLSFNAGYIQGWNGQDVRLIDRFYKGGDTFRGFALAGVGPREVSSPGANGRGSAGTRASSGSVRSAARTSSCRSWSKSCRTGRRDGHT